MRYLGGKKRLGKEISEILALLAPPDTVNGYCEPFCGALGVMCHMVDKGYKTCKAYDACKDLIMLWKEVKTGTFKFPRSISERTWLKYKNDPNPSAMRAFIGFGCSFGGKWFSTYAQKYVKSEKYRSVISENTNAIEKMIPKIKKINTISVKDYKLHNFKGYLIYCDPPYTKTTGYRAVNNFDTKEFWDIVRKLSKNNIVVVSEFSAPKDFKCIWEKKRKVRNTRGKEQMTTLTEKLFVYKKVFKEIEKCPKV